MSRDVDTQGWDGYYRGAPAPSDVYAWYLMYTETVRGETTTHTLAGSVDLLR